MKLIYTLLLVFFTQSLFAQADSVFTESPVVLHTATGDLFGTLTLPAGKQKMPVALIHAGSGPTDRNGNNPAMQNNSLKMLAHALGAEGIASLRFDKRGVGQSAKAAKREADLRFDDYVQDARSWLAYLRQDKRFAKLYVIGHSEGALIGMLAAAGAADAYVSVAGPGRPAAVVLREQFAAQPPMVRDAANPILDSLAAGTTVQQLPPVVAAIFRASVQPYMISWFQYNPAEELARLNMPTLILQGTTDIQVSTGDAALLAKANAKARLVAIPNMNHVLKTYEGSNRMENFATYNKPDLPLHPVFVQELLAFLKGH